MSMYREIVTKAVVGKGKLLNTRELTLKPLKEVSKVLGCWIINNQYLSYYEKGKIFVEGSYDIHLWYAHDNDQKTSIHEESVAYKEEVEIKMKKGESLNEDAEIRTMCLKYPVCTSLIMNEKGVISAKIEKEFSIDIIGETKLKVQVTSYGDEEWILDEEIEKSVDPNYLNK